ncbi:hypothetical protein [Aeromonas phage 62AhydR11PP]|nr:hypothetical protein [Aeromonas phage 62AhydR11PP]
MKKCTKCSEEKPLSAFCKDKQKKDGLRFTCKSCDKVDRDRRRATPDGSQKHRDWSKNYYKNNKETISEKVRIQAASGVAPYQKYRFDPSNKEKIAESIKLWRAKNSEWLKRYSMLNRERNNKRARDWRRANPDKAALAKVKRRAAEARATPAWANLDEIKKIYAEASMLDGVHVDHIVPLRSKLVCGLNVSCNLRIITAAENFAKGNRHWPDMP